MYSCYKSHAVLCLEDTRYHTPGGRTHQRLSLLMHSCFHLQIANPSPSGGRINIQFRRVECAPPTDLVTSCLHCACDATARLLCIQVPIACHFPQNHVFVSRVWLPKLSCYLLPGCDCGFELRRQCADSTENLRESQHGTSHLWHELHCQPPELQLRPAKLTVRQTLTVQQFSVCVHCRVTFLYMQWASCSTST